MMKFKNLVCSRHINKRIAEVFCSDDFTSLLPFIKLKKSNEVQLPDLQIPINCLKSVYNVNNIESVLNMKTDFMIHRIYKSPDAESICFGIKQDHFITSLLNYNLNLSSNEATIPEKKTTLIDISSPNIAKPFHMGHLRSMVIGNFVANIYEITDTVKRINYLGDWGTQIGYVKAGLDALNIKSCDLKDPLREMCNAYVYANSDPNMASEARKIFSELEKGLSSQWYTEWEKIRSITVDHLKETYKSFNISFDEYSFESKYRAQNISSVLELLERNQLASYDNGCLVMDIDCEKILLLKSDGTTLYLVRDIAAALDRIKKYKCDSMIYVVDKSQADHLNKLKSALLKLNQPTVINHVSFGRITGMSTRKGNSIFLDDILNEAVSRMAEQQLKSPNTRTSDPEVTKILGVTALMVYILRQRRNRDFKFSWENALQGTGDSGVKLQYTHSRLYSLEESCKVHLPSEVDPVAFTEDLALELIFELARFHEIIWATHAQLESSFIVSYLFKLCNLVSRCLKKLRVKDEPHDLAEQRLLLFHSARCTINSSMRLLGLQILNKM